VQGFVQVGTRPEIDLAQARTEVANARVQLINAENSYRTAKAQLNQVMGVAQPTPFEVADDSLGPLDGEDQPLEPLLKEALNARPDLASMESQSRAVELTLRATRGGYGPRLSVLGTFTETGAGFGSLAFNVSAGAELLIPLWEGGLVQAQVREARSNLEGINAQLEGLRQQVRLELEQARLRVRAAKESLVAAGDAVLNARERLRLAEGRYQAGTGSILELGDAQLALSNSAAQQVSAQYSLASARAQLQRALGRP
jgi:outer membrane protein